MPITLRAEEAAPVQPTDSLAARQKQIADRYQHLKQALIRMSNPQAGPDSRRAALVKQAVAQSNDWEIEARFEKITRLLGGSQLSAAGKDQEALKQDLKKLLELLLSEDRNRRLLSEKERIRGYLKQINRIIKQQRGLEDQTSRSTEPKELAKDQGELAANTGKLAGEIQAAERDNNPAANPPRPGKKNDPKKDGPQPKSDKSKPGDKDPPGKADSLKNKPDEKSPGQGGEKSKPADGKSQPGKGKPDKPQEGQPSKGKPQQGEGESQPGQTPPSAQQNDPGPPGRKRLEQAQRKMQQAQKNLDDAKKDDAGAAQQEAVRELELAKAELEDILKQLREEEIARTLAALESRFRKMLEQQIEVYDGTKRVDALPSAEAARDRDIEAGRLSRKEAEIVTQADRALSLLREEGSAVAFPEAVVEMRDDMEQVVVRLAQSKLDKITQGLEQDIIAALEEMIKSLQKAQKDLAKKPPPGMPGEGQMQEPGLVDTLSELKMIRALQMRVNKRTQQYSRMTHEEQADQPELLKALERLGEREQRIHRITRDIVVGRNR